MDTARKYEGMLQERHTIDVFDSLRIQTPVYLEDPGEYRVRVENETGFLGGVARVFYDEPGGLPQATGSARHVYLHVGDHLGSTSVVVDKDSGEIVERARYQAFGALDSDFRPDRWQNFRAENKFTGKEEDIEVGLTYFGARYYQAHLGRWASADPLTIHGLGSDLNPYAYVSGRVMSHVDPFGLCSSANGSDCIGGKYWPDALGNQQFGGSGGALATVGDDWTSTSRRGGLVGNMLREWRAAGKPDFGDSVAAGAGDGRLNTDIGSPLERAVDHFLTPSNSPAHQLEWCLTGSCPVNGNRPATLDESIDALGKKAANFVLTAVGAPNAATPSAPITESAAGGAPFTADLSHVTGRTASVRNAWIQGTMERDLPGVRFTHTPQYSPFIKQGFGVAQEGAGTQIGAKAFESQPQLIETLVHEELHHRWWQRGIYNHHADPVLDARFEAIIARYMRMRGFR